MFMGGSSLAYLYEAVLDSTFYDQVFHPPNGFYQVF